MGVCFSKKKKKRSKDPVGSGEKSKPIQDCRDPPPTESPQEEEKVKEVLSETPKLAAVRSKDDEIVKRSRSRGNDDGEEKEESGVNGGATPTPSESATTTATAAFTEQSKAGDEEEEEVGISEKKKTRPRPRSRSQSPAKVVHKRTNSRSSDHRDFPAAVASATKKREMRAVDVGCRTSRSAPSPLKNRSISSRRDTGERSGRRSASPAANDSKMRSFCAPEPAAATTTTTTKGRSSPQRKVPAARAGDLVGPSLRGQDGNNVPTSEAEESLENPLVSMECFIFL